MRLKSKSELYRLKALEAEQRSREATDSETRKQWSELAIEWHTMASFAGKNRDS
ncbi:MAG: hypothetical protein HZB49_15635 [Bradyrhizobium sp.]|nr:hypothetical protein [Bradyrhizobium sp.]